MRANDVDCPTCGAVPGRPCRYLIGGVALIMGPHFDRTLAASSVGQGLKNIRDNGLDAELRELEKEMDKCK